MRSRYLRMQRYVGAALRRHCRLLPAIWVMLAVGAAAVTLAEAEEQAMPDWLEPRGLSVVELVGQVPDEYLRGTIISSADSVGIVVYDSGSRVGNRVVVTTILYPRLATPAWAPNGQLTIFGCLGQTPNYDHFGSVVPPSTLKVYDSNGADVTARIQYMHISQMGVRQPSADSSQPFRYEPEQDVGFGTPYPLPLDAQGLRIPANSGCRIWMPGADHQSLTGVFTLDLRHSVGARVLGTQRATFQSYIGVGNVGIFQPLMEQLLLAFGERHGRIPLSIPAGANFFLVRFPPMPGDAYTDSHTNPPYYNANRLTAGTYRLSGSGLSTNLTFSAAFPLRLAWRDADQATGSAFLPVMAAPTQLAPPEYVLPQGVAYDACFTRGGCPPHVLQRIYAARMALDIVYLSVTPPPVGGHWLPLQMAGPAWSPLALDASQALLASGESPLGASGSEVEAAGVLTATYQLFLPYAYHGAGPEQPGGSPFGWFDDSGRMLGFRLEP